MTHFVPARGDRRRTDQYPQIKPITKTKKKDEEFRDEIGLTINIAYYLA